MGADAKRWTLAASGVRLNAHGLAVDTVTGVETTFAERVAAIRASGQPTILKVEMPVAGMDVHAALLRHAAPDAATLAEGDEVAPDEVDDTSADPAADEAAADEAGEEQETPQTGVGATLVAPRTIRGLALPYNIQDAYGTTWLSQAVSRGTADIFSKRFPFLWMHDVMEPIGVLRVTEDTITGLYIEVVFDTTDLGERALQRALSGSAPSLSVGVYLYLDPESPDWTQVEFAQLFEVSLVTLDQQAVEGARLLSKDATTRSTRLTPKADDETVDPEEDEEPVEATRAEGDETVVCAEEGCENPAEEGSAYCAEHTPEDADDAEAESTDTATEAVERSLTLARARLYLASLERRSA